MTVKEFAITNECKDNSLESPPKGPMGNWILTIDKPQKCFPFPN